MTGWTRPSGASPSGVATAARRRTSARHRTGRALRRSRPRYAKARAQPEAVLRAANWIGLWSPWRNVGRETAEVQCWKAVSARPVLSPATDHLELSPHVARQEERGGGKRLLEVQIGQIL